MGLGYRIAVLEARKNRFVKGQIGRIFLCNIAAVVFGQKNVAVGVINRYAIDIVLKPRRI